MAAIDTLSGTYSRLLKCGVILQNEGADSMYRGQLYALAKDVAAKLRNVSMAQSNKQNAADYDGYINSVHANINTLLQQLNIADSTYDECHGNVMKAAEDMTKSSVKILKLNNQLNAIREKSSRLIASIMAEDMIRLNKIEQSLKIGSNTKLTKMREQYLSLIEEESKIDIVKVGIIFFGIDL